VGEAVSKRMEAFKPKPGDPLEAPPPRRIPPVAI
jgi:hypothetical protein